jgi:pyruvate carboxylase
MAVQIEAGKVLTIKLLAVGPLDTNKGTRECFFELNGETRAVVINDTSAAIEHVTRPKASSEPGSVGSPMSGVVVDVRVKEGAEVKAGDVSNTKTEIRN